MDERWRRIEGGKVKDWDLKKHKVSQMSSFIGSLNFLII